MHPVPEQGLRMEHRFHVAEGLQQKVPILGQGEVVTKPNAPLEEGSIEQEIARGDREVSSKEGETSRRQGEPTPEHPWVELPPGLLIRGLFTEKEVHSRKPKMVPRLRHIHQHALETGRSQEVVRVEDRYPFRPDA
jgi:hypothetical protein